MSSSESAAQDAGATRFPWLGPAFFVAVLIALTVFFYWFLKA
ncbi:hypothetical protein BURK2_02831 [Burkholderiales bacterium]|nr:hypothetical protein BURK2_02831 [Burkholderiales bacterium]